MNVRVAVVAFVASLILSFAALGVGAYVLTHKTQTNASFTKELREGLVENCEDNGNSLRKVLTESLEAELLSVNDPRIPEVFPDVPKEVADRIIREGNRDKRKRIAKIAPVDCSAQYPTP